RRGQRREAGMAHVDRRPDESTRYRLEPERAQGTRQRAALRWRHERLRQDEHLAAQAGHDQARREWRQGARRLEVLNIPRLVALWKAGFWRAFLLRCTADIWLLRGYPNCWQRNTECQAGQSRHRRCLPDNV